MNWPIVLVSAGFFIAKENYFGWNALPKSPEELICDGIWALIFALAFIGK
jgi:hypothetical protein